MQLKVYEAVNVVGRTPQYIYHLDHRVQTDNATSARMFWCDICWGAFHHQGGSKPYEGNFVNKTWNTDADKLDPNFKKVSREELYQGWKDGVYDLTWHCLKCHAAILHRSKDLRGVANDMGLYKFAEERTRHRRERAEKYLERRKKQRQD